jgi:hypothetical protein
MNTSLGAESTEHFRLMLGYDAGRDEVVYNEPAEDNGGYRRMPRSEFFKLWPLKYAQSRWTVVRLRLDAKSIRVPAPTRGLSPADFVQHVMVLRRHLPHGFGVVVEPPFVIAGHVGPRDRSPVHGGQLPEMPSLVQRGLGLPL